MASGISAFALSVSALGEPPGRSQQGIKQPGEAVIEVSGPQLYAVCPPVDDRGGQAGLAEYAPVVGQRRLRDIYPGGRTGDLSLLSEAANKLKPDGITERVQYRGEVQVGGGGLR
jgi:hypothetical protein